MLLLDLFLVGLGALLGGWACRRAGVPEVLGYLSAGILLGPALHGGSLVDPSTLRQVAQFAILFRMFTLGLDFDARRLQGRWRPALFAGVLEMGVCTLCGVGLALLVGWSPLEGAVLGAALGTTSTNILSKAIADRNMAGREDAKAAGAATLAEDLLAMGMLALLTVLAGAIDPATGAFHLLVFGEKALGMFVFAALAFTAGAILVPVVLEALGRQHSEELLTVGVVGTLFGFAVLSSGLGAGWALGGFLAGIAVGAARNAPGVSARVLPLRDLLAAAAYVSLGLFLEPAIILRVAPLALAASIVFVLVKSTFIAIGLRLGGVPTTTAARAGAILGQVGTIGLVFACGPFLPPENFKTLLAFAFVAWCSTVALTTPRLTYGPDVAERVARLLGAGPARPLHGGFGGPTAEPGRHAYRGALASACGVALAALAALLVSVQAGILPPVVALPVAILVGALLGALVLPFAIASAASIRRSLTHRIHDAALSPGHLRRAGRDPARVLTRTGTVTALCVALVLPLAAAALLAPPGLAPALLAGLILGGVALVFRARLLDRLCEAAAALVAGRERPSDLRLHDFRGLHPFGVETEAVPLPEGARAARRRLEEIPLQKETGARFVAVLRGPVPHAADPGLALRPGDEVVLVGTPTQLVAGRRFLTSELPEHHAPTHEGRDHVGLREPGGGARVAR